MRIVIRYFAASVDGRIRSSIVDSLENPRYWCSGEPGRVLWLRPDLGAEKGEETFGFVDSVEVEVDHHVLRVIDWAL